jgi:hypothetical protein
MRVHCSQAVTVAGKTIFMPSQEKKVNMGELQFHQWLQNRLHLRRFDGDVQKAFHCAA